MKWQATSMGFLEIALRSVAMIGTDGEAEPLRLPPNHWLPATYSRSDRLREVDALRLIARPLCVHEQHLQVCSQQ